MVLILNTFHYYLYILTFYDVQHVIYVFELPHTLSNFRICTCIKQLYKKMQEKLRLTIL